MCFLNEEAKIQKVWDISDAPLRFLQKNGAARRSDSPANKTNKRYLALLQECNPASLRRRCGGASRRHGGVNFLLRSEHPVVLHKYKRHEYGTLCHEAHVPLVPFYKD